MKLEDYDIAICGMVDTRYRQHKPRIERIFKARVARLEFQVNGRGNDPGVSYAFTTQAPPSSWRFSLACFQHFVALQNAVALADCIGAETLLWLEDDCELAWNFDEVLDEVSTIKAPTWDLFYYGANHSNAKVEMYSPCLFRTRGSLMSHMVGIRRSVFDKILAYKPTDMMDSLFAHDLQHRCESQAVWPNIATQIPGRSTLWGIDVDYADVMEKFPAPGSASADRR